MTSFLQLKHPYTPEDPKNTPEQTESPEPTETPSDDPLKNAEYIPGDVTCDGIIDVTDLSTLAVALVEHEPLVYMPEKNADVDHDGEVTLADLARLRQYLSKKIESFDK